MTGLHQDWSFTQWILINLGTSINVRSWHEADIGSLNNMRSIKVY